VVSVCSRAAVGYTTRFTGTCNEIAHFFAKLTTLGYRPEPHILLFRRPLGTDPVTGKVNPELEREAKERYEADTGKLRN
jgi:hypothetical protein